MATNNSSNGSGDYLDVVAFIDIGMDKRRQPRTIGYAKASNGKVYLNLQMLPVVGSGWDGSLVVEKRRDRDERDPDSERPPARAPQNSGRASRPR